MSTESKTPETKAALRYCTGTMPTEDWCGYMAKTCQRLETQRDEARAAVKRLRTRVAELEQAYPGIALPDTEIDLTTGEIVDTTISVSSTTPEIFEAHGLEWYRHDDRLPIPCAGDLLVGVNLASGTFTPLGVGIPAKELIWVDGGIKGWRPADAPAKLPRNK